MAKMQPKQWKMQDVMNANSPLMKQAFKAPILLWRLGLGPLFGKIVLVMTMTGRTSGQRRRTAAEFYGLNGKKYSVVALGAKADWYKNLAANPHVTVQSADGTQSCKAYRVTDDAELAEVFKLFLRKDAPLTNWYLKSLDVPVDVASVLANKDKIYILGFEPTDEPCPAGLDVDLAWLWPVAFAWLLLFRPRRRSRRR